MLCCVLKLDFNCILYPLFFATIVYSLVLVDILHTNEIVLALTWPEYPSIAQKVSEIGDRVQWKQGNREYLHREKSRNFPVNPLVKLKGSNQNLNQNGCHFDHKKCRKNRVPNPDPQMTAILGRWLVRLSKYSADSDTFS